jgi:outer membrane translocation and assembly module TamA
VGVGLRVNLPIGAAIRLDLGYPLIEEETTRHARFSLWIQSIVLDACAENV